MKTFSDLGLTGLDALYIILIGLGIFALTYFLYPPLIKCLKGRGYVGYDIHKKERPETAESGGLGATIGILVGVSVVGLIYPPLRNEMVVFIITILTSAFIGWVDDRIQLSSITKIVLMVASGVPIFVTQYVGFIDVQSPILPIIGQLRLTVIYPLTLPIIVAIMTNTVNMLEGYNGEGSGTTVIATFFLIVCGILAHSGEAVLFGVPVFFAILAFFLYNKYPAKIFPGDVGTLTIGASLAMLGILGSMEVVMALVMLTHIFNSFYVLASIHGWLKMKSIKDEVNIPDIWIDEDNTIHATKNKKAPLTLPRLLLAKGGLEEDELVNHFLALATISGLFALASELIRQNTLNHEFCSPALCWTLGAICIVAFIGVLYKFPRIIGISLIMILLLFIGLLLFYIIDQFIITDPLNWLYSFSLAGIALLLWYSITIKHFWHTMGNISIEDPSFAQEKKEAVEKQKN